ncbi:MAG: glycosyltransferase [Anaerolineae bacterium]|nr:glycosyltransferase [Anaerolineae bacterium]
MKKNLVSRFRQTKISNIHHLLVCDALDFESINLCKKLQTQYNDKHITLLIFPRGENEVASKISKMNLALQVAKGEVVGFIDDDIELYENCLFDLVQNLFAHTDTGVVFGLPIAVSQENIWSTINTMFVNTQAFFLYIPLTYLINPFTITGHIYLLKRDMFDEVGGFLEMDNQFHDDNALAVRLMHHGYTCLQTKVTYKVHNYLATMGLLNKQLKRWFMMPRKSILQNATASQQIVTSILSLDFFIPFLALILAITSMSPTTITSFAFILAIFILIDQIHLKYNLKLPFKIQDILLYPFVVCIIPLIVLMTLITPNPHVYWREQKIKLKDKGFFEVVK